LGVAHIGGKQSGDGTGGGLQQLDFHGFGLGFAQAHTLVLELDGDGVAERGDLHEPDHHAGHEAQSEEALVHGALRMELHDAPVLADGKRRKCLHCE
jgi:hypothetical protein